MIQSDDSTKRFVQMALPPHLLLSMQANGFMLSDMNRFSICFTSHGGYGTSSPSSSPTLSPS